jgi:putative membrane protein
MKGFILGIVTTAIAFVVLVTILPSTMIDFAGSNYMQLGLLAIGIGLVNAVIKPVVKLLSMPITLMTLGLFGIVINAALMLFSAWFFNSVMGFAFTVGGWPGGGFGLDAIIGAFVASIVLGILTAIIGHFIKD